jgi:hypothetical protein
LRQSNEGLSKNPARRYVAKVGIGQANLYLSAFYACADCNVLRLNHAMRA